MDSHFYKYWGKAAKDSQSYHLLPFHCLDVAAVGWLLLNPQKSKCKRIAEDLHVDANYLRSFFTFCLALHDIGKFARAFQGLKPNLSSDLVKHNPRMVYEKRHDSLGYGLYIDKICRNIKTADSESRLWKNDIKEWMEIVTGHHGVPPQKTRCRQYFESEDEVAAIHFFQEMCTLFLINVDCTFLDGKRLKKRLKVISWQLAGIAVLADWIGSNDEYFLYNTTPMPLGEYWHNIALPSARKAVEAMPEEPEIRQFKSLQDLFPFIDEPTPLQNYAIHQPLTDGPQLFIFEDVTGAGKTEAAFVLTHRLLSAGLADGLYVALPTMATANAMYERLGNVYRLLYTQNSLPSLILAHSFRNMSDKFRESVYVSQNRNTEFDYFEDCSVEEDLSASTYCNAWLADSRKKSLLADVGVGTLDQALLAVLPARHQSLRMLGLDRKVLLIDEVHAYDSYMQQLLDTLLEAHTRQGGSTILLSATLPKKMRRKLIEAYYRGLDCSPHEILKNDYPLSSHASSTALCETHVETRRDVKRDVRIKRVATEHDVFEKIKSAVEKGKCVCWIRNTVKAARKSYADLSKSEWLDEQNLHLFHSRFALVDRQRIELDTLKRFGETSTASDRRGQVLIATQVVEQSLDLDFDILISDLAPIDLIIQRAGRLCRHIRDLLGNRLRASGNTDQRGIPVLYLFTPDPEKNVTENWLKDHQPGTQAVYPNVAQLWLTARRLLLEGKGGFTMPSDARSMIEAVYSDNAENEMPDALKDANFAAVGENSCQRSMADLNALKLKKGYTWSSGRWDEEVRIPTRLNEYETVSVALARIQDGKLHPYAQTEDRQWSMSVVRLPDYEWNNANAELNETVRQLIEELKNELNILRWVEIFPLSSETERYYSDIYGWVA